MLFFQSYGRLTGVTDVQTSCYSFSSVRLSGTSGLSGNLGKTAETNRDIPDVLRHIIKNVSKKLFRNIPGHSLYYSFFNSGCEMKSNEIILH
jgi:hypothetical protein